MSVTLQSYMVEAIGKKAEEMIEAFLRLPEDKRSYQPEGCRSPLSMMAEVIMMNGFTKTIIESKAFPADFTMDQYMAEEARLKAEPNLVDLYRESLPVAYAAIGSVSDADLSVEVPMPWGMYTIADIIAYPFWNTSYHTGQIYYIAMSFGIEVS